MKKIAVLISGQGLTLQAIIDACKSGYIQGRIVTVVSNCETAFGLQRASQENIPTRVFLRNRYANNQDMDQDIARYLMEQEVDLILLAGYMKVLTPVFVQTFLGKILNIHPSLLPKFAGLNTYQRAIEAGETEHGTTVHFVNEEVDGGAIILQAKVPIFPEDDIIDVEQRVKSQERFIYPLAVKWFIDERLELRAGKAYLDGVLLPQNGYAND